jgi:6-pyruvoyl-tetrahydropterin synthase
MIISEQVTSLEQLACQLHGCSEDELWKHSDTAMQHSHSHSYFILILSSQELTDDHFVSNYNQVHCLLPKWLLTTRADNMALPTPM